MLQNESNAMLLTVSLHLIVGADAEDDRIELLLSEVKGKDITELIAAGREKFASVPSGGAAVAVAAPGGGGGDAAAPAAAAEAKKEEKVEEKEESDDVSIDISNTDTLQATYLLIFVYNGIKWMLCFLQP